MDTAAEFSGALGLICAIAGVLARPANADVRTRARFLATAACAAVPVVIWILWCGHALATGGSFLAATVVAGEVRARAPGVIQSIRDRRGQ